MYFVGVARQLKKVQRLVRLTTEVEDSSLQCCASVAENRQLFRLRLLFLWFPAPLTRNLRRIGHGSRVVQVSASVIPIPELRLRL